MGLRTQDLIFTLYGDYLLRRGGRAWIGSLIELLGTLDVSEQAVRSAASRMARKGWLASERQGRNSYYSLTSRSVELLEEGAQQIFHPKPGDWDGSWYLITYAFSDEMKLSRHRLRKELSWLGFGQLTNGTLISPRDRREEVRSVLDELDVHCHVDYFRADHVSLANDQSLAKRCWDLEELNEQYREFIASYQARYEYDCRKRELGLSQPLDHAFRQRFWLVHEYRYFPFRDPYLPAELLPDDWLGAKAAGLFQNYQALLRDGAIEFVDTILSRAPGRFADHLTEISIRESP